MARRQAVNVRVVNRLVRYTASESIDGDEVVSQLGGKKSGKSVILALKSPRATLLIDEQGRSRRLERQDDRLPGLLPSELRYDFVAINRLRGCVAHQPVDDADVHRLPACHQSILRS